MKLLLAGLGIGLAGIAGYSIDRYRSHPADAGEPPQDPAYHERLAQVPPGEFDPLSVPMETGIVWYGTWEDAMAEKERTGKPVMLHFGSPRCPSQDVCVPGTW